MATRLIISIYLLLSCLSVQAQELLFYNIQKQKTITVRPGQTLCVSYKGYNNVREFAKLMVTDITDSTIILGTDPAKIGLLGNIKDGTHLNMHKVVSIKDIEAFRRITLGRTMLKTVLRAGIILSTYFFIYELSQNNAYSAGEIFAISMGVGIGGTILVNALLPENAKYKMKDGWEVRVVWE